MLHKEEIVKFLELMKNQPYLWDPQYKTDRRTTREMWYNICKELYPQFDEYPSSKQEFTVLQLKKKWKCFRDMQLRYIKTGKGKPHLYSEMLSFLNGVINNPHDESPRTRRSSNVSSYREEDDTDEDNIKPFRYTEPDLVEAAISTTDSTETGGHFSYVPVDTSAIKSEPGVGIPKQCSSCGQSNPDREFLLLLEPDYKKLTDEQKLDFKIMSLQFFRTAQKDQSSKS